MAYQDTHSPLHVMGGTDKPEGGFLSAVGRHIENLMESLTMARLARARFETVTTLNAMSDVELAQLNLTREDITRHVFKDLYYS